jgi:hypothetical protein
MRNMMLNNLKSSKSFNRQVAIQLPLNVLIEAIDQLPTEDARQIYRRLSERLA